MPKICRLNSNEKLLAVAPPSWNTLWGNSIVLCLMRLKKILVVALLLHASSFVSAETQRTVKIKVGMIIPLSGAYASGGVDNQRGVEAALAATTPTSQLEIIYADSKGDPVTGINEFRRLTESERVVAVYVMRGSVGTPLNPLSLSSAIPLIGGVGNKDFAAGNRYAFQAWSKSDEEGTFLAQVLKHHSYDSVALFTVQDDWQSSVSDGFRAAAQNLQLKLVSDQDVVPSESDFRSLLLKVKSSSPRAIFANLGVNQIAPFLRQVKDLQISSPVYCNFWVSKKDVIDSAGVDTVEGVRFVEMNTNLPSLQKFVSEKYSSTPSGATLSAYASTLLLLQTISRNSTISTKEELYAALLNQTEITTPDGAIPIVDRRVKFPLAEKIVKAGKIEVIVATQ